MKYWIFATLALMLHSNPVLAQGSGRYDYLAKAADRIIALSEATADPTPKEIEGAAAAGCGALQRLLEDKAFLADLAKLEKAPQQQQERSELKRDLRLFTSAFMRWEKDALRDAGLDGTGLERVLWAIASARDSADRPVRADEIINSIQALQRELCAAAQAAKADRRSKERRETLATWGLRIGGVLTIAANGAFAAPSGGFALASAGIGGGLMGLSFGR